MEKVKLTQEQADAIEYALTESEDFKDNPDRLFRDCIASHISFHSELYALNNLDVVKLAKVLFGPIGYEVEPEFKVGDWFTFDKKYGEPEIVEIEALTYSRYWREECAYWNDGDCLPLTKIRHATPEEIAEEKQRRWWANHARDVWELKRGDVLRKLCSPIEFEALEVDSVDDEYIILADFSRINSKTTQMDINYKVVCFAEDRKDIKQ